LHRARSGKSAKASTMVRLVRCSRNESDLRRRSWNDRSRRCAESVAGAAFPIRAEKAGALRRRTLPRTAVPISGPTPHWIVQRQARACGSNRAPGKSAKTSTTGSAEP
jgi:hypothetical protein